MAAEFWVMRVVSKAIEPLPRDVAAKIVDGTFHVVNGEVAEPVSCWTDQETALIAAQRRHAATGDVHKVVLNADLSDLT